jgi:MFS family permease
MAGIILFKSESVVCGAAPTLWMLISARAAQGLGAAVMMALTMAFVGETVPKERTGSAMGLLGTMSAIGTALGPSLGGALIAGIGWRAIFLVNLPLGILAFILTYRHLPADRPGPRPHAAGFDAGGTALLALTLAAYALAMTLGRGHFGSLNLGLLFGAALGTVLFVRAETKAASPLIQLAIFRDPTLSASLAMSALVMTVMMATLVIGPFFLSRGLGLDAGLVGLVMSVGPFVAALAGLPAGRIVDRFGAQRTAVAGLVAIAAGSFSMAMMPPTLGIAGYIARIVLITAGHALFQAANNTAVMMNVGPDQRGVISGVLNLSRNLGLITGASVMGAVFALASSAKDIATAPPEGVIAGMRTTFAVAAVLILVALAIAVGARRRARLSLLMLAVLATPLIAQEKPREAIISGQIRLRSSLDGRGILDDKSVFVHLLRSRVRATVRPIAGITVLAEVQDSRWWGQADPAQARGTTDADADAIDMHQAWAQIDSVFGLPVSLRVGRQEMKFANERLIGVSNGSNTGRSFDAARATLVGVGLTADFFASRLAAPSQGPAASQNFYGAWGSWKPSSAVAIDLFGLRDDNNATIRCGADSGHSVLERYTAGTYVRLVADPFDAELEGAMQVGDGAAADTAMRRAIRAFMASGSVGFTLLPASKTRVYALATVLSGDGSAADRRAENFNTLFGTNHRLYGYMDIVPEALGTAAGLVDISGGLTSSPSDELRLGIEGHLLKPQRAAAGAYGAEVDMNARWRVNSAFELFGVLGMFLPGPATITHFIEGDDPRFSGYISGQFDF